jgi:4-hydroxy-4-methyl-2-oxoglutarate aldolase
VTVHPEPSAQKSVERVAPALVEAARAFSTATLHEAAGQIGALPSAIKPICSTFRVAGPAFTVKSPGGDNLWMHRAIYAAQAGDVLVVHTSGQYDYGYWGEIMSTAAKARGIAGLVIDGCVRDGNLLQQLDFPVFARGLCIRGTTKDPGVEGWINAPVLLGGHDVMLKSGDLIVGDGDGVVCIPGADAAAVLRNAQEREAKERDILERLRAGASTLDLYGWR